MENPYSDVPGWLGEFYYWAEVRDWLAREPMVLAWTYKWLEVK